MHRRFYLLYSISSLLALLYGNSLTCRGVIWVLMTDRVLGGKLGLCGGKTFTNTKIY